MSENNEQEPLAPDAQDNAPSAESNVSHETSDEPLNECAVVKEDGRHKLMLAKEISLDGDGSSLLKRGERGVVGLVKRYDETMVSEDAIRSAMHGVCNKAVDTLIACASKTFAGRRNEDGSSRVDGKTPAIVVVIEYVEL